MNRRSFLKTLMLSTFAAAAPGLALPTYLIATSGDDLAALMDRLADGGTLFVQPGVYHCDRTIHLRNGKRIELRDSSFTFSGDTWLYADLTAGDSLIERCTITYVPKEIEHTVASYVVFRGNIISGSVGYGVYV